MLLPRMVPNLSAAVALGPEEVPFRTFLPAVLQVPSRATLRRPGLNATPDVLCFGAKKLVSTSSMTMVPAQHMQNAHTPKMSVRQGTLHTWYAYSRHGKPPQANRSLVVTLAPIRVALPEEYYSVCAALQRNRGGRPSQPPTLFNAQDHSQVPTRADAHSTKQWRAHMNPSIC